MNFFKGNNDKSKEVPTFPAGDGGIEAVEYGFETIHTGVCPFDFPSFLIHLIIVQPIILRILSVSWIGTYIGNDSVGYECASEFLPVKACVKVTEKTIHGDIGIKHLADDFIDPFVYLIEVGVIPGLRLGHGEWNALIVRDKERVGRASFLSALIFSLFSASIYWRMGTVDMGDGQIELTFIPAKDSGINLLLFLFFTPFTVMMEDCVPAWSLSAEKMPDREQTPLAAALELIEYGVYHLNKIKFGVVASFCNRKIRHYFSFNCIFVEYSVFWHWYGILECGNYNIVRPLRNALYFNYFIVLLTSRN